MSDDLRDWPRPYVRRLNRPDEDPCPWVLSFDDDWDLGRHLFFERWDDALRAALYVANTHPMYGARDE